MGFQRIFWGLIFMFDFRINGFDILPDIIGYMLIFSGLGLLIGLNRRFETARKYAAPMIFLSFFDIYQINIPLNNFSINPNMLLPIAAGIVGTLLNLLMIYYICRGIQEKAAELGKMELEDLAGKRWGLYLLFQLITMASFILIFAMPFIFIFLFIFSVIVYLLMLGLMSTAEKELEPAVE